MDSLELESQLNSRIHLYS